MQEPKRLSVVVPRQKVVVNQEPCNQKSTIAPHAVEVKLGFSDSPCPVPRSRRPRRGRRSFAPSPRPPRRAKGPRELKRSIHVEIHFAPREPFPPQLGPILDFALARLAHYRRSLVKTALLHRLLRCRRHGIPHPELHRSLVAPRRIELRGDGQSRAGRCCVPLLNLQDSIEALKRVDLNLERLRHHVFDCELGFLSACATSFCAPFSPAARGGQAFQQSRTLRVHRI
jgi:hypothetical protein